jgi:hypothetical protein
MGFYSDFMRQMEAFFGIWMTGGFPIIKHGWKILCNDVMEIYSWRIHRSGTLWL